MWVLRHRDAAKAADANPRTTLAETSATSATETPMIAKDILDEINMLEGRVPGWHDTYARPESADAAAVVHMTEVRAANAHLLVSEARFEQEETKWRVQRDRDALREGLALEQDLQLTRQRLDDAIAGAESLRSPAQVFGTSTDKFLLAQILDELQLARVRADVVGMTHAGLVDLYRRSSDSEQSARVRAIENHFRDGALDRLGIRPDPDNDALSIPQLQRAVADRRRARVPVPLLEARGRMDKILNRPFTDTLALLRRGLGIANRPRSLA